MGPDEEPGFAAGTILDDGSIELVADDDDDVEVADPGSDPLGPALLDELDELAARAALPDLRRLIQQVPAGRSGAQSGARFQCRDSTGSSLDALDIIANPDVRGAYLGVYHSNLGGGRFALSLASSRDLASWSKITALHANGGSMGTLRALPGGAFLLAYESQGATAADRRTPTNVRLCHYRDAAALLAGRATEHKTLPRRLSPTNEGTPHVRSIAWRGSLASSVIKLGFHYLDYGPKSKPFRLAVDREAHGTLSSGRWSVQRHTGIDRALSRMGFHGNHGGRRQFRFPPGAKQWRIYEAQKFVNVTGSWRTLLYDMRARRLHQLRIATPGGSRSFANPTVSVLPSPRDAGADALVVTMFIFGAGAGNGEAGELVHYSEL